MAIVARARGFADAHPVAAVFLLALLVRVVAAIVVAATSGGTLFLDDESYQRMASQAASGADGTWDSYLQWLYTRTGTLLWPITGLYEVFGAATILGQLYVATLGAAAAALTTAVGLEFLRRPWALAAGLIVALLPSQVLWSSLILKDAAVWAALAGLALIAARMQKARGRRLVLLGVAAVALLVALVYLRLQTFEVALVALLLAGVFGPREQWFARVAVVGVIFIALPLVFARGPGGIDIVRSGGSLTERRDNNAVGAKSAVVTPPSDDNASTASTPPPATTTTPATTPTTEPTTVDPADRAVGAHDSGLGAQIAYLPKGLTVVGLRPYPWEVGGTDSVALRLASLESFGWYALLLLGIVGLWGVVRRHLRPMLFPLLTLGAIAGMYALTEGNLGTAYRHRGEFVWPVALLASAGLATIVDAVSRRRRSVAEQVRVQRSPAGDGDRGTPAQDVGQLPHRHPVPGAD